jgi:hypothetical protein
MQFDQLLHRFWTGVLALVVCSSWSPVAMAVADPPGRVGRLNYASGPVTFSLGGDSEWIDAQPNRPLVKGDRLWTDRGSRAEIQVGSSAIRLDGQTRLEIVALNDQATQLSLTQGTVYVRVRSLPDGEVFAIDTPNLAYHAAYPGDYRVDVDASDGTTRVTIHSGTGIVYGESGHAMPLGGGQQVTFRARALAQVATQESPPQDAFDKWSAERNRLEDQSISARYVPREVVGYQQLDAHGQWRNDATHGAVWFPQGIPANWAPYRSGHWEWIAPWGWTWIDDAPWGFAPFHYGRWALIESHWAWVPGNLRLHPIYAPALVAFVANGDKGILTSLAGQSGVAWFPLAPGEFWQPGFQASGAYISSVNRHMMPGSSDSSYAYQRRSDALTAVSDEDFQRGRPAGASWLRIAANAVTNASVVPPPAMPTRMAQEVEAKARPVPPARPDMKPVNTDSVAERANEPSRRDREAAQSSEQGKQQVKPAEDAKAQREAKSAEHARLTEQAKAAQQAKVAEQAKAMEQAKVAEQARLAERARAVEQAKAAEQARLVERAKAVEQARAAEKARLAERAKAAQRAEALAREAAARAEASRREAQAKKVEAARREAADARAATARREQAKIAERDHRQQKVARAEQVKREQQTKRTQTTRYTAQARRDERQRTAAQARRDEHLQQVAHAQQVEQARRAAEQDAQVLREQRQQRDEQARRDADEREKAQREQQAAAQRLQRDQQVREEQQRRERARYRPDLGGSPSRPSETWQRGVPILNPGPTS